MVQAVAEQPERRAGLGAAVRAVADGRLSRPVARGGRPGGRAGARSRAGADRARLRRSGRVPHRAPPQASFERAIALNPSDPLPRFGLGLAQIRDGSLEQGRPTSSSRSASIPATRCCAPISAAPISRSGARSCRRTSTRSPRSSIRSTPPPTSTTRSACRRSTGRSRRCASSTSRSSSTTTAPSTAAACCSIPTARRAAPASPRIYQDLDFLDTGVREATNSLTLDPTNPSAHRFLADIYAGTRRTRDRRGSASCCSRRCCRTLNSTPVPPALGETNLNIVTQGGPTTPGLQRVHAAVRAQRAAGHGHRPARQQRRPQGRRRSRPRRSMIATRSAPAAFGYDTDGWRDNGDIRHKIGDVYLPGGDHARTQRAARDPKRRSTTHGDIEQAWDPDSFSDNTDRDIDQDSFRGGVRWSPTPNSDRAAVVDLQRHGRQGGAG